MNSLREFFAPCWRSIQTTLFPWLEQVLGPLTEKQQQLVQILEIIRIEDFVPRHFMAPGRPPKDRASIARAFVAKAVYDMPTTRVMLDRLATDASLRRLCGWERKSEVPSESVFSRAFAEFAGMRLTQRVHEALIRKTHQDRLTGHISRDSTAIDAREADQEARATRATEAQAGTAKESRAETQTTHAPAAASPHVQASDAGGSSNRLRCRNEEK